MQVHLEMDMFSGRKTNFKTIFVNPSGVRILTTLACPRT